MPSYISPITGSRDLAAWRGEIPAERWPTARDQSRGGLLRLSGRLLLTIDGETEELGRDDAGAAPAGSALAVTNPGDEPALMWVTTRVGLSAPWTA